MCDIDYVRWKHCICCQSKTTIPLNDQNSEEEKLSIVQIQIVLADACELMY